MSILTICVFRNDILNRVYGVNYKLDIYLRIAEYFLKIHEIQEAEVFVNRASLLQPECQNQQLLVRYKVSLEINFYDYPYNHNIIKFCLKEYLWIVK